MTAHINIGTNIGHRADNLSRAVSLLAARLGSVRAVSRPVESAPWGYESPHPFMNIGVNVETTRNAAEIVAILKNIENEIAPEAAHRDENGNYADRLIDLDLICLDDTVSNDPEATVPHPRMHMREFVLRPMAEIMPGWTHPPLGKNIAELLDALHNKAT